MKGIINQIDEFMSLNLRKWGYKRNLGIIFTEACGAMVANEVKTVHYEKKIQD